MGWAKEPITPKRPIFLAGYSPLRKSAGVHDDVYVKVIVFYTSNQMYLFLSYDLVAVDCRFTERVKEQITRGIGPVDDIVVSATHTHSAPAGTCDTANGILTGTEEILGGWDEKYVSFCIEQTLIAVKKSIAQASETKIKQAETDVLSVSANRNEKEGYSDTSLLAIECRNKQNEKILICHYSCHPTILNQKNKQITKDLIFGIEQHLEKNVFLFFLNGNAGNLSTRFTRKSASFAQVDTFGKQIAQTIRTAVGKIKKNESLNQLSISSYTMKLKSKQVRAAEKIKDQLTVTENRLNGLSLKSAAYQREQLIAKKEGLMTEYMLSKSLQGRSDISVDYQIIQLNESYFFTFPGEVYSTLTLPLKKKKYTVKCLGYTNGFNFYLTDRQAFKKQTYEALSSPFAEGEGERFIKQVNENLLKNEPNL